MERPESSAAGCGRGGGQAYAVILSSTESLDKFKVPEKEKGELLAIASTLKADIVEKP